MPGVTPAFPGDPRLSTWAGMVDVELQLRPDGSALARIINVDAHPELAGVASGIGRTEDEAVTRLAEAIYAARPEDQ